MYKYYIEQNDFILIIFGLVILSIILVTIYLVMGELNDSK